jgi:hypothetical protein
VQAKEVKKKNSKAESVFKREDFFMPRNQAHYAIIQGRLK